MLSETELNETLADAVMARPREFFIGQRRYCLWPLTLGKSLMLQRHLDALDIDYGMLSRNASLEVMRIVANKRSEVCYIIAIASFNAFSELCNSQTLKCRATLFEHELDADELAKILLVMLREPKVESLLEAAGIVKDQQEQARIARHKNRDGHTLSFGGKSIFGQLIDAACQRYGWTKEYVVWGIDLTSLKLMLADSVNTVYLSDDDIKALGLRGGRREVYGMTEEDIAKLKAMDWT